MAGQFYAAYVSSRIACCDVKIALKHSCVAIAIQRVAAAIRLLDRQRAVGFVKNTARNQGHIALGAKQRANQWSDERIESGGVDFRMCGIGGPGNIARIFDECKLKSGTGSEERDLLLPRPLNHSNHAFRILIRPWTGCAPDGIVVDEIGGHMSDLFALNPLGRNV